MTSVLFVTNEKQGSDAVYAAGWNKKARRPGDTLPEAGDGAHMQARSPSIRTGGHTRGAGCRVPYSFWRDHADLARARMLVSLACSQVFVWQDDDDDVVEQYRTFEGHKADILTMSAAHSRGLLATGAHACVRCARGWPPRWGRSPGASGIPCGPEGADCVVPFHRRRRGADMHLGPLQRRAPRHPSRVRRGRVRGGQARGPPATRGPWCSEPRCAWRRARTQRGRGRRRDDSGPQNCSGAAAGRRRVSSPRRRP